MSELRERLHRIAVQVDGLKKLPMLQRASAAEQVLQSTMFLFEGVIDELEQLKEAE